MWRIEITTVPALYRFDKGLWKRQKRASLGLTGTMCPTKFSNILKFLHGDMSVTVSAHGDFTHAFKVNLVLNRTVWEHRLCTPFLLRPYYFLFKDKCPRASPLSIELMGESLNLISLKPGQFTKYPEPYSKNALRGKNMSQATQSKPYIWSIWMSIHWKYSTFLQVIRDIYRFFQF